MLQRIIYFSIHNKIVVGLLTLALVAWGVVGALHLPIDAVPDITNNQVQIITWSHSLSPQEVEQRITYPIEFNISNIPNLLEIRSISRFGLSVVTAVFNDETDIYWARQQIAERLKAAAEQIPPNVGTPEMGPVATGLSEIYQYTLRPKKGYENRYPPTELRTLQDWLVRRQLMGTPGVADISSFGGFVKQYEVALDPERVRAMGITIAEVFDALQKSNENAGGAYIDKGSKAWYIRTEGMVKSLADVEAIVLKTTDNGLPITIKEVGKVQFGHSVRYGTLTQDENPEVVGGIVLMLKGKNSNQVIGAVKERIKTIEKSLPEGLMIDVYLDRSELINRAIHTVGSNLVEGALIVIFVLVLMLGNIRAGLLVASVIPLAMLFALGMMDLFGVSGNLMSLGAIDFGLIVDGAVIVVEATLHHIVRQGYTHRLTQAEMDEEVFQSASKIRNSAAFGEIIILIVYLPLLALVGIEGKMFRPMAQTVAFAILGAFILSLTYVPMMSALFLGKEPSKKAGFSETLVQKVHKFYEPIILWFLTHRKYTIATTVACFGLTLWSFSRLGGEFIPSLDEGDFAVETRLLPGTSLEKTVDATMKATKILKARFPEVKKVVGKIGTSEIPTDPMPFEACDLMILLHDRSTWTSAHTKDELAEKMQAALADIPGVNFGFQQPIQMRFNELMTGARQDVAIKIYGEDLNELERQASNMARIISKTEGLEDLYVESATGLPQMVARINREQLALYGLHVDDVNKTLETAFAGSKAGTVFDGEKSFDLVVRLAPEHRNDIEDLQNLYISSPGGQQIPLSKVAEVSFRPGPNQIQRDDAKRRIIVAFNVRGRDVESVVNEINQKCDDRLRLPPGYYYTVGGQFKNLIEARERLLVAVPVALLLIFVLLYFSFRSWLQSLLVFTAIPLSAMGGVWALWLRDMPFSISAGVGFIALFGVAVLNGIVLLGELNYLKAEGIGDLKERILLATHNRLRPVLMTALVASLGFLPMALSTGAGAEVQKPLATVVIGGLVSATVLTLFILPLLYCMAENRLKMKGQAALLAVLLIVGSLAFPATGQDRKLTLHEAIELALKNHPELVASRLQTKTQRLLQPTASEIGKTSLQLQYGQYNSFEVDNNFTIAQTIPFPTAMAAQKNWQKSRVEEALAAEKLTENEIVRQVKTVYAYLLHTQNIAQLQRRQDSLLQAIAKAAALLLKTGETNLLEKAMAESQVVEIKSLMVQNEGNRKMYLARLRYWTQSAEDVEVEAMPTSPAPETGSPSNPAIGLARQQEISARQWEKVERSRLLPDITAGYFNQSLTGIVRSDGYVAGRGNRFQGVMVGMQLPLWFGPAKARVNAAETQLKLAETQLQAVTLKIESELSEARQLVANTRNRLQFLEQNANPLARLITQQATQAFNAGQIGMVELSAALKKAMSTEETILEARHQYILSTIQLEFLQGTR